MPIYLTIDLEGDSQFNTNPMEIDLLDLSQPSNYVVPLDAFYHFPQFGAGDITAIDFNFSWFLSTGETISSYLIETDGVLTVISTSLLGIDTVKAVINGGLSQEIYALYCQIITSNARIKTSVCTIRIR
jgi:hypothetical protein